MDKAEKDAILASMVPVKDTISPAEVEALLANETPLQKSFDNRKGPSVNGSPAIDYHVFSPVKAADTKRYPVLVWLHGMSQGRCFREPLRGTEVANFASPAFQEKFDGGAYIVVPRANEDLGTMATVGRFFYSHAWLSGTKEWDGNSQMPELAAAIRQFLDEEAANVDLSQVYLVGFSAGGYMTWQTLLAMPDVFAAAVPICQALFVPTKEELATLAGVPLWVICGEKDTLYAPYVLPTIELLEETHQADLRVTVLESVLEPDRTPAKSEHHAWVPVTFDMFYGDGEPYDTRYPDGFVAWLMGHKK